MPIELVRPRPRRRRLYAALAVTLGASIALSINPLPDAAQATPSVATTGRESDALTRAHAEAVRVGERVEVTAERTEATNLYANPSGTLTVEMHSQPVRVKMAGQWRDIDAAWRRQADGGITPVATPGALQISGGGTGPLVSMTVQGKTLKLTWPAMLPAPDLDGDTATYVNVLPDVDLQVRALRTGGFSEALVVKTPAAAANPALHAVRFGATTSGLTLKRRTDGGVIAVDAPGNTVLAGDRPMMWDSPSKPTQRRNEASARTVATPASVTVIPDRRILTAPTTDFPVHIAASFVSPPMLGWTHVNKNAPDKSYWTSGRDEGAKVGHLTVDTYRSYFVFPVEAIRGTLVKRAYFRLILDHSFQCGTDTPTDLYGVDPVTPGAPTTWNSTVVNDTWHTKVAQASGHANTECGEPDQPMEFGSPELTALVQRGADGEWNDRLTLGLKAANEGSQQEWKRFAADHADAPPILTIEYNTPPQVPTDLRPSPLRPCGTEAAPTLWPLGMSSAMFITKLLDADNNNVSGIFEIAQAGTVIYGPVTAGPIMSGSFVNWTVPPGVLAPEIVYSYRARAQDTAGDYSDYTERCYFIIDGSIPAQPAITSDDFPNDVPVLATGQTGTVAFSASGGVTDIAGYRYGFDPTALSLWAPADSAGEAMIPITLWPERGLPFVMKPLYVRAVDRAGNGSPLQGSDPYRLTATLTDATPSGLLRDFNGDGTADVVVPNLDLGFGRAGNWLFASDGTGAFHQGVMIFDSGYSSGDGFVNTHKSTPGDFNGDGLDDGAWFQQDADAVRLYTTFSDGNQAGMSGPYAGGEAGTWRLADARIVSGDFDDGQGPDDVAAIVHDGAGGWTAWVYTATGLSGDRFNPGVVWATGNSSWEHSETLAGDFTGDGRTDLAFTQDTAGGHTTISVHPSTGTGFGSGTPWWDSGTGGHSDANAKYTVANVTGSGADDIVALYNNGTTTSLRVLGSTGTAFAPLATWWTSQEGGWDWQPTHSVTAGDYDGDGDIDVATIVNGPTAGHRQLWTFTSDGSAFAPPVKRGDAPARI